MSTVFVTNEQLYRHAIEPVSKASSFVWIGMADIKDLHVKQKGTVKSFLSILDGLARKKVSIRLLHAKEALTGTRCYGRIWKGSYAPGCILNILSLMANLHIQALLILPEQVLV